MEFQCGEETGWENLSAGTSLDSGCKIKIKPGTYCHFLLPDGSLLTAFNFGAGASNTNLIQGTTDLVFQINLGTESTLVVQNVTVSESGVVHRLPEGHKLPYFVEFGDYQYESLGTEGIIGNPASALSLQDIQINIQLLWGSAILQKNPNIYPSDTTKTAIKAGQSVQTPAYIADKRADGPLSTREEQHWRSKLMSTRRSGLPR